MTQKFLECHAFPIGMHCRNLTAEQLFNGTRPVYFSVRNKHCAQRCGECFCARSKMHSIGGGDRVALALLTNAVDCDRIQAAFCDDRHNQTSNFIPLKNLGD